MAKLWLKNNFSKEASEQSCVPYHQLKHKTLTSSATLLSE
jgi:hypothetical protein